MSQAVFNPYAQYQEAQYETAPKERLLVMLYDGLIRFNNVAMMAIQNREIKRAHDYCLKVQNILAELMSTLKFDLSPELAHNLFDLYEFLRAQTIKANVKQDAELLRKNHDIYVELREAWVQAAKNIALDRKRATA